MIFFIPAYDQATSANLFIGYKVATTNSKNGSRMMFGNDATPEALTENLKQSAAPLFIMSHGRIDAVMTSREKKENEEIALASAHCAFLKQRSVYAFACNTATQLGQIAAQHGSIWLGYTGAISAPETDSQCCGDFVQIFQYIANSFPMLTTQVDIKKFWQELRQQCVGAQKRVQVRYSHKKNNKIISTMTALFQIWDRLRIWLPGARQPEKHPDAALPILQSLRI